MVERWWRYAVTALAMTAVAPAAAAADPGAPGPPASEVAREAAAAPRRDASAPAPYCAGDYADDLAALSTRAREFEARQEPYTYCIRTSAIYECPSYAPDGTLRKARKRVVAHGTGFGYRQPGAGAGTAGGAGAETLVVTNAHVADWPAVTDEDHPVEGVPEGCRRVSERLRIVEDESDAYDRDDIPLARVVADAQLDVAVLRAKAALPVVPWKLGHSAALRERNVVDVRGFPLGVLRANNVGKVVSAYEHDDDRDWDHDDFIVDALLSPGNSGSPVFAISCRTGELELVGLYHAAYVRGSALNAVVGIDQLRDLLTTLRRAPRARPDAPAPLDASARPAIVAGARRAEAEAFFPFGPVAAAVRARADGALVFEVMPREFPLRAQPVLVLEDLPPGAGAGGFGALGRVWAGDGRALWAIERASLDGEARAQLAKLLDALRRDAALAVAYHAAASRGAASREQFQEMVRLERSIARGGGSRQDLGTAALELAERLADGAPPDGAASLADALAPPSPVVSPGTAPPGPVPGPPPAAAAALPVASSAAPGKGPLANGEERAAR